MQMRDLAQNRKMAIFAGVMLAMLLGALDSTIVGPAMPQIIQHLGGMNLYSWVFTIYSLASTIAIPIVGKLSDLYGRKWFYLGGIAIFLFGSAACGAAGSAWLDSAFTTLTGSPHDMLQLIIFRGIQGLGGGMMMANGMAIVGDLFAPRERARYQGMMGAVFGLASVVGPMIGGWLTDGPGWRWIFYVNLPVGIVALAILFLSMPQPERGQQHRVDWWGATALTLGLTPLLLALNWGGNEYGWGSRTIIGLFIGAAVALLLFILRETRASEPILDMSLFRDRSFSASMIVLFLSGVGMFGSIMFLPTFMQLVQGASASKSGSLLMPMMLSLITGSILTGQAIARTGRYKAFGVVGLAIASVGMFFLSRLQVDSSHAFVIGAMLAVGFGVGVTMPLFTISLQSQFPTRLGEVTGALQFFRSIGGTVGVALLGGVMNSSMRVDLASRMGEKGVPALQMLWQPGTGPFSPEGLKVMFEKLADKLPSGGESFFTNFIGSLRTVVFGSIPSSFDPSNLLNTSVLKNVGDVVAAVSGKLPPAMAAQLKLTEAWDSVTYALKASLTTGVADAFLYGTMLLALAVVAMLFVREVPLSGKPHLDTASEIATEILVEEAVQPAEHEPVIVGDLPAEYDGAPAEAQAAAGSDDAAGETRA